MPQRVWMLGACLLALGAASARAGAAPVAAVSIDLGRPAGKVSPFLFGCSLPAPGTPGAAALLPELLRNGSFEKGTLTGPKRMPEGWRKGRGWQLFAFGGKHLIARTERDRDEPLLLLGNRRWPDYRLSLRARKIDGQGGLQVLFEVKDKENHIRWTLGANGNRQHVLESVGRGSPRALAPAVPGHVEAGRCYRVDMSVRDGVLQCSLDGRLVHQVGDARFESAGIGLGATDSTAEYFDIAVYRPENSPLFLLDDPSKANQDSLASDWAPLRGPKSKVHFNWDPLYPFNSHYSQSMRVEAEEGDVSGIGQSGVPILAGTAYQGRLHLRGAGRAVVAASLRGANGKVYAEQTLGELTGTWRACDFTLKPNESDPHADFAITVTGTASVWVDQVSLVEAGSRSRWGLRSDVVAALRALRPTLLCWPAGAGANQYNWQRGTGPVDERPVVAVTTGSAAAFEPVSAAFGTDEFLALCQELGAEPLIVLNPRLGTPAVLDLLNYCNAAPDTPLGRQRAANGHADPYGVRFWLVAGERVREAGGQGYPVTVAELARDVRGFRPTPQLAALGGPLLTDCEEDTREARLAGPMVTHTAKRFDWEANPDQEGVPTAALADAARQLRAHSLSLALPDYALGRLASSSAAAMGMFLNELSREGGPAALAAFRCTLPRERGDELAPLDLLSGRRGSSPAKATWELFRSRPVDELLSARIGGPEAGSPPFDLVAGRKGNELVLRFVALAERESVARVKLEGLGSRHLAPRAEHFVVASGAGGQTALAPGAKLEVRGGEVTVPLTGSQAVHVVVLRLEGE